MSWVIEPLTLEGIPIFVELCHEFSTYTGTLSHLGFDSYEVAMLGEAMVTQPTHFCQLAFDADGKPVGFMAGYITKLIFSKNYIGNEEGLYVREGVKERTAMASEMLRRFVRFCSDAQCVDVRTGVISNIDNYAVDVFYRRNKFKRIGMIYAMRNPLGDK